MTRDTHDNYNEILYKIAKLFAELQRILYLCTQKDVKRKLQTRKYLMHSYRNMRKPQVH